MPQHPLNNSENADDGAVALQVTGYVDRLSLRPGESLHAFVSCTESQYSAELVRLIHGDRNPRGPGHKEVAVAHPVNGEHPGRQQTLAVGSCVVVDALPAVGACTVQLWICPTLPARQREQGIVAWGTAEASVALLLDADGHVTARFAATTGVTRLRDPLPLEAHTWYFVALTVDDRGLALYCRPARFSPDQERPWPLAKTRLGAFQLPAAGALFGALALAPCGLAARPLDSFNGKLDSPRLFDRALTEAEIEQLSNRRGDSALLATTLGWWDFTREAASTRVPDRSPRGHAARTINRPVRLVPGANFSGRTITPDEAPQEFNAVHLHEDDLADAGWHPSLEIRIPEDLRSGIYALKLRAGQTIDYVSFCVRPPEGRPSASLAVLVPTVSYVVYANIGMDPAILPPALRPLSNLANARTGAALYARQQGLRSCYDLHTDGSGVAMASMLRPLLFTTRPGDRSTFNDSPHQLGADLHLIDWLETKGIAYDIVTDHDLHREGAAALHPYRVVLSGTHAEYWTMPMQQALETYTSGGGRFVYLSGNGLYWVTALSEDGTMAEVRRPHGTRAWSAEPGAAYLSLSGELGGLWMHRGLAPQSVVGVGFSAQGFGPGRPYQRTPASHDGRFDWLFDGIEGDLIGDTPALVSAYGAAGYEIDRADTLLGTPGHATVLASATGFSDCYQYAVENAYAMMPGLGGTTCPEVRADLVYFDTPQDGAVLATGSIAWCSTLSWNSYDNPVSRFMENAIGAFLVPGPLRGTLEPRTEAQSRMVDAK